MARVRSGDEIEAAITLLGGEQSGLVVMTNSFMAVHHRTLISAAVRNNVPAIFELPLFARQGANFTARSMGKLAGGVPFRN